MTKIFGNFIFGTNSRTPSKSRLSFLFFLAKRPSWSSLSSSFFFVFPLLFIPSCPPLICFCAQSLDFDGLTRPDRPARNFQWSRPYDEYSLLTAVLMSLLVSYWLPVTRKFILVCLSINFAGIFNKFIPIF